MITYQGRVLDPDGRPYPGSAVYLLSSRIKEPDNPPIRATSGTDGRFRFDAWKSDFAPTPVQQAPWKSATILARAPGYAFALADDGDASKELTLRLPRDDVPIAGRIIDLEGRPVAGATVKVISVRLPLDGTLDLGLKALKVANAGLPPRGPIEAWFKAGTNTALDSWIKDAEQRKQWDTLEYPYLPNRLERFDRIGSPPAPAVIPDAVSGPDGGFRITGIGRARVVLLRIEGPSIETKWVQVRTRPGATLRFPSPGSPRPAEPITIYGATFEHVAGPARAIEGVVRDADTGKPVTGVIISGRPSLHGEFVYNVDTITDSQGRYRLVGLPLGRERDLRTFPPWWGHVFARPDRGTQPQAPPDPMLPYVPARVPIGHPPGSSPIHLDIHLKRGVWIAGRILDKATRKPVPGLVEYFAFDTNPYLKGFPDATEWMNRRFTSEDGAFRLIALPGPGVLAVSRVAGGRDRRAARLDTITDPRKDWFQHMAPDMEPPRFFTVINQINPAPGSPPLTHDLLLEPADRGP
jgi:hypothetical protein